MYFAAAQIRGWDGPTVDAMFPWVLAEALGLHREVDEDGVPSGRASRPARDVTAERVAFERGQGPKPEAEPTGDNLAAFAMQFPGLVIPTGDAPPAG